MMENKKYKKWSIIISNFSHVYESYDFFSEWNTHWIDCSGLVGVDGMCDKDGSESIQRLFENEPYSAIHLLDNGNYHYLSLFWCSKIPFDFSLVLFDHHSDMQKSIFDEILSCGGWVKSLLDSNSHLRHVYMFGVDFVDPDLLTGYEDRITLQADLSHQLGDFPLYLSIDLDVLSDSYMQTNWDQGHYSFAQLLEQIAMMWKYNSILGVDICGEDTNYSAVKRNQTIYRLLIEKLLDLSNE